MLVRLRVNLMLFRGIEVIPSPRGSEQGQVPSTSSTARVQDRVYRVISSHLEAFSWLFEAQEERRKALGP